MATELVSQFKVNPEYEALFPKLSKEEFEALKLSIEKEGQHYKIVVNDDPPNGVILDGHHRDKACLELGRQTNFEVRKFADKLSEKMFVIESNLRRRHLNVLDSTKLGVEIEKIQAERAKQILSAQGTRGENSPRLCSIEQSGEAINSRDFAAKTVGLKPTTYYRAKTVLEKGSQELQDKVRNGEKSISDAFNMVMHPENETKGKPTSVKKRAFDVWGIAAIDMEKPFGDKDYPGKIPGDIIGNVLLWFLPDGGKVVDPMAGGGVTEDVCKFLGKEKYPSVLFDSKRLHSYTYRNTIKYADVSEGKLPNEANNAALIFADPPYGPLKEYGMTVNELYRILGGLSKAAYDCLRTKGIAAVLMQNYYAEDECQGEFIPLARRTVEIFEATGFKQIFEITVPLYGKVARSKISMTHIDRRLMVFQK